MFANFAGAMRDTLSRFFAIKHLLAMLVAFLGFTNPCVTQVNIF